LFVFKTTTPLNKHTKGEDKGCFTRARAKETKSIFFFIFAITLKLINLNKIKVY
jgi:hypothetical protein